MMAATIQAIPAFNRVVCMTASMPFFFLFGKDLGLALDVFGANGSRLSLGGDSVGDRYYPATVMGGQVYHDDAPQDETVVDMLVDRVGHRKVNTASELEQVIETSARVCPPSDCGFVKGFMLRGQRAGSADSQTVALRDEATAEVYKNRRITFQPRTYP